MHGRAVPALAYRFDTADGSVVFSGDTAVNGNLIALTGLLGAPLTTQVARIPDLLHEPIVLALAAVVPPNASMQVTATPTPRRRKLLTTDVPSCWILVSTGGRASTVAGLPLTRGLPSAYRWLPGRRERDRSRYGPGFAVVQ
jgi:hypothetical protein